MKILVTPLNWGLGHASRCIPIIKDLCSHGCEVILASDGRSGNLLKSEFPDLPYYELPSYDINYEGTNFTWMMLRQAPKTIWAIRKERRFIQKLVNTSSIDIILSDNRFGCFHEDVLSIFISHQLHIIAPAVWLSYITNKINQNYISRFHEVWVPDFEKAPGLAGILSHDHSFDAHYLGVLSRMKKCDRQIRYDVCIVLSGPEPKRTELEEELIKQALEMSDKRIILIQGITDEEYTKKNVSSNLELVTYMNTKELNITMIESELIVSRSGYSTVMDLYKLNKRALLIPTPNQTEQEMLATNLKEKSVCDIHRQGKVNLSSAYDERYDYKGFQVLDEENNLTDFLKQWLMKVESKKASPSNELEKV